ncbi:uncharacterized protein LOC133876712 [Alnus glutinosa]|uniref:uncharacterized protein LOC133876712 n=1 Tax=Alnus glutinosa TaxID=3517 RepID=UPI002D76C395|nr:uncharacterized protein LOC133876712 [Alnus glutinosa]
MGTFQNVLTDCRLMDMGYIGPKFTWCNGRQGSEFTKERLDRAVSNGEWGALFNVAEVEVLTRIISDHHPLQVRCSNSRERVWEKSKQFKYEAAWARNKEQGVLIKRVWRAKKISEDPWQTFQNNLFGSRRILKQWVRKQKSTVEQGIQEKVQALNTIQMADNEDFQEEEHLINEELHMLLEQEDLKWRQRAKESWLQLGDRNTKYFHACASQK